MTWLIWSVLILTQNMAFVANSRARNSSSLSYHAITNLFSNGIWIVSQFFLIDKVSQALKTGDVQLTIIIVGLYVGLNLCGGLSAHHFLLKRSL